MVSFEVFDRLQKQICWWYVTAAASVKWGLWERKRQAYSIGIDLAPYHQ